jgi:cytochrome c-type biogenesis protein CcmH/NrfG
MTPSRSSGTSGAPSGRSSGGRAGTDTLERPLDPEQQRALEEERDFLLRSLDDLEAELAVGNVYLDEYERLRDEYTVRAAEVLRSLDSGIDARLAAPPMSRARRVTVAVAIIAFVVGASWLLADYLGERVDGGTVTGNDQLNPGDTLQALQDAVAADPEAVSAHVDLARFLLSSNDLLGSLKEYDAAFELDPTNPEAAAYSGWIRTLVAPGLPDAADRADLFDRALERLDAAVAADAAYPDAHFFRGMTLCNGFGRTAEAVEEWQRYLETAGAAAPRADAVQGLIDTTDCGDGRVTGTAPVATSAPSTTVTPSSTVTPSTTVTETGATTAPSMSTSASTESSTPTVASPRTDTTVLAAPPST